MAEHPEVYFAQYYLRRISLTANYGMVKGEFNFNAYHGHSERFGAVQIISIRPKEESETSDTAENTMTHHLIAESAEGFPCSWIIAGTVSILVSHQ